MAQQKFGSAGVNAREIDLSGPQTAAPTGIPAGIIGTALKGPAFVPVTVGIIDDFYAKFGLTDGKKFGPLAVVEWLKNAQAVTYLRVLGVGNGQARVTAGNLAGSVPTAGFVVGQQEPDPNTGFSIQNPNANYGGPLGRMYVLGAFMSESLGSNYFSSAGLQGANTQAGSGAVPIVRGLVMAPSGVILRLSSSVTASAPPASTYIAYDGSAQGWHNGSVSLFAGSVAKQEFVMLLNGHTGLNPLYPNVITASFDMTAPNYFPKVFNRDPLQLQNAGHYLYSSWDIHPSVAVVTGTSLIVSQSGAGAGANAGIESAAFLTTGSAGRNAGGSTVPNYENFQNRFETARSPWVISQKFGGLPINLFRVWLLDDGEGPSQNVKLTIENPTPSTDLKNKYGTFDLCVRNILDRDAAPSYIEQFRGVTLDPSHNRYIAKVVGDFYTHYDFDHASVTSQKLVIDGNYPNLSNYIRVEMDNSVNNGLTDPTALPMGVRGYGHLVTSGSDPLTSACTTDVASTIALKKAVEPPVPFRQAITAGGGTKVTVDSTLFWGVQFEAVAALATPNLSIIPNQSINAWARTVPEFMTVVTPTRVRDNNGLADTSNNGIMDADRFNSNLFTLENIQVVTASTLLADPAQWLSATYVRGGNIAANDPTKTRAFGVSDLTTPNRRFAKFTFFTQGGFDGVDIFNFETANLTNNAVLQEMTDPNRLLNNGPTVVTYTKALNIMQSVTDVDIQLLAIPGIREAVVTDAAWTAVTNRFDALYLMDIEGYDTLGNIVTGSSQVPHVGNTVTNFTNRALDTNFGAAYYPDVVVTDPNTKTNVIVPPSVVVLGAFALNDRVAYPWFAPAGFTRGALASTLEATVKLYKENLDQLYEASINPLVAFPGNSPQGTGATGGVVVWGQRTLQQAASALDRVNVRRLLIAIRREVKRVSNQIIFEPNREATLKRFSDLVNPILTRVQAQKGVDRFLVKIDTTTTSQADIDSNTIRGKIFLAPTRSIEYVALDFVVSNAGQNGL